MRDIDAINKAIDKSPFHELLALADIYEEQKKIDIANGYRWLSKNEKIPMNVNEFRWEWDLVEWEHIPNIPYHLPVYTARDFYRSRSEAYYAAAVAMGKYLKDKEKQ